MVKNMYVRVGEMNFYAQPFDGEDGYYFGFALYPFDNNHIIVYKGDKSKVVKIEPDTKNGYTYRMLKKSIKCGNGLESFLDFIKRDLKDIKIGEYLCCTFSDFVAREAFLRY